MEISKLATTLLVLMTVSLSGCAMCSNPFDECYPAFGGSRPRADMLAGRVGSKFVEAGVWTEGDAVVEADTPRTFLPSSPTYSQNGYYDGYLDGESFESQVVEEPSENPVFEPLEVDAPEMPFDPVSTDINPLR
jgi:hypothetical protein